jgi:hypothetical protein
VSSLSQQGSMLNVIKLRFVILSSIKMSDIVLVFIAISVGIVNVIKLSVIMPRILIMSN